MILARLGVDRPVLTAMITLIIVVLGLVSLTRLRVDLLPPIERPTASVRTDYPGAGPAVVERRVTQVLEEIVSTVPGVVELASTSSQGESRITVRFAFGQDINLAVQELRATIEDELSELPEEVDRPQIRTFDINSFPVVLLGIGSELDPVELTTLIDAEIRDRLARVPGVAQVDPWGGFTREVRVAIHPERLRALGLPLDTVIDAILDSNVDLPVGRMDRDAFEVALRAPADFVDLDELRRTAIDRRDGGVITIDDVADVHDTYEELTRIIRVNGQRGVRLALRKQVDANTVEVAGAILDEVDSINRDYPQLRVVPVIDQGNFIEQSITNVGRSVAYGGVFAVLVLLFFLRDLRSTGVVGLSIPVSILGTFALLYLGGYTLNLMTLGGLALGVGMMVDSAIVVLENIFTRRERGDDARTAAIEGTAEVAPAIIASTITTLVIFLPVLYLGRIAGQLFSELAVVIALSLSMSLVVSLTVVPMLAARLPAVSSRTPHPWIARVSRWAARSVEVIEGRYARWLDRALRARWRTAGVAVLLFVLSLGLIPWIGTELLPPTDEGEVRVTGEMVLGTRLGVLDRQTRLIEEVVAERVPNALASITSISGGTLNDAEGEVRLNLGPTSSRSRSNTAIAADLLARLEGEVPGMDIRTRAPQGSFALNRLLGSDEEGITIEIRGDDLAVLDGLAVRVIEAIRDIPGITDLQDTRPEGVPEQRFVIDRARIADLGLSPRDVGRALQIAVAGQEAGEYREGGDAWRIFVQMDDRNQRSFDELLELGVQTPDGGMVPLRQLVRTEPGEGPIEIVRREQRRVVTVLANVAGRPQGTVAAEIVDAISALPTPAGTRFQLTGAYETQQETFGDLQLAVILALILVFMVLAGQYESLRDPLVVMVSVPFAGIGVLVALFATNTTFNLQSGMGAVMLGGIVVNNAILLVDLASRLRRDGASPLEAARQAGRGRLRPILMTTATTLLGLLPLALGLGEGSDAQSPLARAMVGGLATSTLSSLLLLPIVYVALTHLTVRRSATATEPPA